MALLDMSVQRSSQDTDQTMDRLWFAWLLTEAGINWNPIVAIAAVGALVSGGGIMGTNANAHLATQTRARLAPDPPMRGG